ncbi:hypothetical protein C1645_877439 [Glomus cerebriforme]|uniref:Uncharacterized protein n=1 Tax=Glomus cerebriforme TaxID=658196 RepID=A0A397SRN5_9GLOM|nr:hypothetical protein C1645_877439 [Glomus cerebriforme]
MAQNFGPELHTLIMELQFNPDNFYTIFRSVFNSAYKKFEMHIPQHPAYPLFHASLITELGNPSDELLHEWAIYCNSVNEIVEENINLDLYWVGKQKILPILSNIVDWQNLSCESLKQLNMLYFNGGNEEYGLNSEF